MDNKHTNNYQVEGVETFKRRLAKCHSIYECHVQIQANL
jgi:hypothetical protein